MAGGGPQSSADLAPAVLRAEYWLPAVQWDLSVPQGGFPAKWGKMRLPTSGSYYDSYSSLRLTKCQVLARQFLHHCFI